MAADRLAPQIQAAVQLYASGRAETARTALEGLLQAQPADDPAGRLVVSRALLDICLRNGNAACLTRHVAAFVDAAARAPTANAVQRGRLALEAAYYADAARDLTGAAPADILADPSWSHDVAYDGELYLRRQTLASNLLLQAGRRPELDRTLNKILSVTASLQNPQVARITVADSLADVLGTLIEIGETDRAWGLYRASGADIATVLPPMTLDAVSYELTEARLLQEVGDAATARLALQAAIATLRQIELDPALRETLLAQALNLKAALDAVTGDLGAARAALAEHPFAALYARPGRAPASPNEIDYLAARSLLAATGDTPDPIAAGALQGSRAFQADPQTAQTVEVYRAAGAALAVGPGPERRTRLVELGRRLHDMAQRQDRAGQLERLGTIDRIVVGLALTQADAARTPAEADVVFNLVQLAARTGASFDADALTALGQTHDELQRRTVHQALRLKARRDRLEREGVQVATRAMLAAPQTGLLRHDIAARGRLRDYDERLARAETRLARDGLSLRAPRLTSLAELQAALAPDEAALAVVPTIGGLAYMCVRHDRTLQSVATADPAQLKLDAKLVQAALTASYPPSETLDAQFPADAAVRLYGALLKPFEPCLAPNDRIVWLGGVASADVPLAALLPAAPPKLEHGYDLAAADWVVRRHAISYAGSAGALVALRRRPAPMAPDFDFLGVGDPQLAGRSDGDTRFAGLAPLPETADELEASAKGFAHARLLTQDAATEAGVRSQLIGDYRYLSFATHGLLREDLQGLSDPALVLTPASTRDTRDDGLLTASEIADLNLRASFVALSACNTANFDYDQIVQDLPALASAFAVSGVPATLGTLWPVNSQTGQAVVAGVFARLREQPQAGPAEALAQAQRAFLAAPPGRAYLHPRFWATFVVLGDGRAAQADQDVDGLGLTAVDTLTPADGEVLALARTPDGLAARFIAKPDADGHPGEGVRLASRGGEAWRQVGHAGRASRALGWVGDRLVAGGYEIGPNGHLAPRLDAYDRQGRRTASWRGEAIASSDAGVMAAAPDGPEAMLIVVGEPDAGRLQVLRVGADLLPRPVFIAQALTGGRLTNAALAPMGDRLLITYTTTMPPHDPPPSLEDYDAQVCAPGSTTWVELRDRNNGALLKTQTLSDYAAVAAVATPGGVALGGSRRDRCDGERQAAVISLDAGLAPRTAYLDDSLGASEVRTMAPLARGALFVAAYKESLFDYAPGDIAAGRSHSTLMLTLDARGHASTPKLLDAGADLLPTTAIDGDPGEILLGGALAGRGAIFHLSTRP